MTARQKWLCGQNPAKRNVVVSGEVGPCRVVAFTTTGARTDAPITPVRTATTTSQVRSLFIFDLPSMGPAEHSTFRRVEPRRKLRLVAVWDVLGKRRSQDDFEVVGGVSAPDADMALM